MKKKENPWYEISGVRKINVEPKGNNVVDKHYKAEKIGKILTKLGYSVFVYYTSIDIAVEHFTDTNIEGLKELVASF